MFKAYKFRLYPNKKQEIFIKKQIGCCRFIYNYSLAEKIKAYETQKKQLSQFDLNRLIPKIKEEYIWLKEVNSQSLQHANSKVDAAFRKFFREKQGFPKFKSKHNSIQSFGLTRLNKNDLKNNEMVLPKIGAVNTRLHRKIEGKLKSATVSMTSTNKYFISVLVEDGMRMPKQKKFNYNNTIGIDVGISSFATLSTGKKIENPKYLRNSLQRLKILQRRASKKQKGSMNRRKANFKVALLHEKIKNQRNDFLHKFTHKIVSENQAIAIETLNIKGMQQNHCLAQAISDVSWSECFRQLRYKTSWTGKTLLEIGQFEPSSKICSFCGTIYNNLELKEREWSCFKCNTRHDRDINAAINIKKFALQKQNLIGTSPKELRVEPLEMSSIEESRKEETIMRW